MSVTGNSSSCKYSIWSGSVRETCWWRRIGSRDERSISKNWITTARWGRSVERERERERERSIDTLFLWQCNPACSLVQRHITGSGSESGKHDALFHHALGTITMVLNRTSKTKSIARTSTEGRRSSWKRRLTQRSFRTITLKTLRIDQWNSPCRDRRNEIDCSSIDDIRHSGDTYPMNKDSDQ